MDENNIWHVLPQNDLKPHIENSVIRAIGLPYCECECRPEHMEVMGGMVIVHHSFDGREGVEWANEILNNKI
jgi:hypothetical protein